MKSRSLDTQTRLPASTTFDFIEVDANCVR